MRFGKYYIDSNIIDKSEERRFEVLEFGYYQGRGDVSENNLNHSTSFIKFMSGAYIFSCMARINYTLS